MERVGILGLPGSGKSTVFEILVLGAGAHATTAGREHVAVIVVPDERLDRLAALLRPRKTTHARMQFVDAAAAGPGARAAARGADLFSSVRNGDALLAVLRDFENPAVPAPEGMDPARDLRELEGELILNDLAIVESRHERLGRELRLGRKEGEREHAMLERLRTALEGGHPLRHEPLEADERKLVRGFQLLTLKPLLVVVNQGEGERAPLPPVGAHAWVVGLRGRLEREVVALPGEERAAFRRELGIEEDGLSLILRACFSLLGLISFFTLGPEELRAWTLSRGARALDAAAAVHTDMAKAFIRAEVIPWDRLLEAGGEAAARERGWTRLEGRDYPVQDGDCVHIRFGR